MDFVNNWRRDITLASGVTSAALDLPDGIYRIVVSDAAGEVIEVVGASVTAGAATLTRGQEGTADANWPAGSKAYCSLTAGTLLELFAALTDLQARVTALEAAAPSGALTDQNGSTLTDQNGTPLTGEPA